MSVWSRGDLERLYARLEKPLYNVVFRRLWDVEDAHDVVQEAFVKLWAMRRRVVPETVEPLVYRIALNLARSRLRRKRILRFVALDRSSASREVDPPDDALDAEQRLQAVERQRRIRRAIEALPDDVRDVLLLSLFGELSYAGISRAVGLPEGTVGSRRNRALRLLRERLAGEVDERRS